MGSFKSLPLNCNTSGLVYTQHDSSVNTTCEQTYIQLYETSTAHVNNNTGRFPQTTTQADSHKQQHRQTHTNNNTGRLTQTTTQTDITQVTTQADIIQRTTGRLTQTTTQTDITQTTAQTDVCHSQFRSSVELRLVLW